MKTLHRAAAGLLALFACGLALAQPVIAQQVQLSYPAATSLDGTEQFGVLQSGSGYKSVTINQVASFAGGGGGAGKLGSDFTTLSSASALTGAEILPASQGGTTKGATVNQIVAAALGAPLDTALASRSIPAQISANTTAIAAKMPLDLTTLASGSPATGAELIPVTQGGAKAITTDQLLARRTLLLDLIARANAAANANPIESDVMTTPAIVTVDTTANTDSFTGSCSGTVLTVSAITSGPVIPGLQLTGTGITTGTLVVSQASGTAGSTGTYNVSASCTASSATITGFLPKAYTLDANPTIFRCSGGAPIRTDYSGTGAGPFYYRFGSVSTPAADNIANATQNPTTTTPYYRANAWRCDVETDATLFELFGLGSSGKTFRLIIDGRYVSKTPTAWGGGTRRWLKTDTTNQPTGTTPTVHRITLESEHVSGLVGINVPSVSSAWAPSDLTTINAAFIGNSMPQGTGATAAYEAFPIVTAQLLGWSSPQQVAIGGTDYLNTGGTWNFGSHITDLSQRTYQVVGFAGAGYNDIGQTAAAVQAAAYADFVTARSLQPNALLIVSGTICGATGPSAACLTVEAGVKAAYDQLAAGGEKFAIYIPVSNRDAPYETGTGYQGAQNGTGTSDNLVYTDGVHPNDLGHVQDGKRFATDIRSGMIALAKVLQ